MELQALKAQCKVIRRDIISMLAMAAYVIRKKKMQF